MSGDRRRRSRRGRSGQAFSELALAVPVLIVLVMGTIDLGRAFYVNLPVTGMASGGAQLGSTSATADIDVAVRQESNVVPNNATAWGDVFPGGANSACTTTPNPTTNVQQCGDAHGCLTSGSNNAFSSPSRVACFAVGTCTIDSTNHNGQCTSAIAWQTRSPAGSSASTPYTNAALVVKVVYAFNPATPLIAAFFTATGKVLYLSQTSVIPEGY